MTDEMKKAEKWWIVPTNSPFINSNLFDTFGYNYKVEPQEDFYSKSFPPLKSDFNSKEEAEKWLKEYLETKENEKLKAQILKWHDLRKDPNDLPKCAENEQVIFYVQEYYKEIGKCKNHYCLGVYKKSFLNDDVKLFVERSKGYECEHSTECILFWCELPKFEE